MIKTLILTGETGGTITKTDTVENYPGFNKITGFDLAMNIINHAKEYDIDVKEEMAEKVERLTSSCFKVTGSSGATYFSKTIIFATGTIWRKLKVPGEEEFANRGVHYCALCDGAFYKNKVLAVVGGSDSAAKDALLLTQYATKVYMIYRGEKIRPEPVNYDRCMKNPKLEIIYNTNVKEIKGEKKVTQVLLDKAYNGSHELPLDGLFIAIGHIALSQLAKDIGVATNEKGEIIIDREAKTNIPGVFAAGDVVDTVFKQAITGVGEGVLASYSAYEYTQKNKLECPEMKAMR